MSILWRLSGRVAFGLGLVMLWVLSPISAGSQQKGKESPDQLALSVGDAQQANLKALKKYSWTTTTTLTKGGETMATETSALHFDGEGKLQATPMGGESNIKEKRGLRGRREKKKIGEFDEYLEGVLEQSFNYVFMSKGMLVDLFDGAKITQASDAIQIDATDVFVKGDSVKLSVDPSSHLAKSLAFKTTYQGDAIDGSVTFAPIEKGPNRATHFELQIPSKTLSITSKTSDWTAQ